jgi:superfamily II DNA helicase RecQ
MRKQDMEKGKYHVVIINPETLMGNDEVEKLWKKPDFTKRLLNFIFDEGHCISQWGSFRKEYAHLGALRYLIPERVPFYVASATLPLPVLLDVNYVIDILQLRLDNTYCNIEFRMSTYQYGSATFSVFSVTSQKFYCQMCKGRICFCLYDDPVTQAQNGLGVEPNARVNQW